MVVLCDFQQLKHPSFAVILFLFTGIFDILLILCYCFFGKIATESFQEMADHLYEVDWQDVRIDLQKYYVLMIQNAHCPIYYHGFHLIILDLNTFTRVSRSEIFGTDEVEVYFCNVYCSAFLVDANGLYVLYDVQDFGIFGMNEIKYIMKMMQKEELSVVLIKLFSISLAFLHATIL